MEVDVIAAQIRTAINDRDMDSFRSLMATDATWGDPDSDRFCRNRDQIIANYKRLLNDGVAGTVVETITDSGGVACLLEVEWPDPGLQGRGTRFYQVFAIRDDLIVSITGHDTEAMARSAIAGSSD